RDRVERRPRPPPPAPGLDVEAGGRAVGGEPGGGGRLAPPHPSVRRGRGRPAGLEHPPVPHHLRRRVAGGLADDLLAPPGQAAAEPRGVSGHGSRPSGSRTPPGPTPGRRPRSGTPRPPRPWPPGSG